MKNCIKQILIYSFLVVILFNLAEGACSHLNNAILYYNFTVDCGDSSSTGIDCTETNTPTYSGDFVELDSGDYFTIADDVAWNSIVCFSWWFNKTYSALDMHTQGEEAGGGNWDWQIYDNSDTISSQTEVSGSGNVVHITPDPSNFADTWHFIVVCQDTATGLEVYWDGVSNGTDGSNKGSLDAPGEDWHIGEDYDNGAPYVGHIAHFGVWDYKLSSTNVTDLISGFTGTPDTICNPYESVGGATASVTLSTNLTTGNYTHDIQFEFNGTVSNTLEDDFNCTLYLNDTVNSTLIGINISEVQYFQLNYSNQEIGYNINVTCLNNNATDDFTVSDVFLDSITNEITSNLVSGYAYGDEDSLNLHWNYTDTNLFAVFLNISCEGSDVFLYENIGINGTTYWRVNVTNATSDFGVGNCTVNATYYDSHTDKKLKEKAYLDSNGDAFYSNIKFYCDLQEEIEIIQETDKVKYKIKFTETQMVHYCYYEYPEAEYYSVESIYPNHYVEWYNKIWIDDYLGEIEKLNSSTLKLKIRQENPFDEFETSSIGDLNVQSNLWNFSIYDAPTDTEAYLHDINESINEEGGIADDVEEIREEIEMGFTTLALIILWLGLWAIGLHTFTSGNEFAGGMLILLTIPVDIFFAYIFRESLNTGTGFIGAGMTAMCFVTIGIVFFLKRKKT